MHRPRPGRPFAPDERRHCDRTDRPPGAAGEAIPQAALQQLAPEARGGRPGDPDVRRAGPVAEHATLSGPDPGPLRERTARHRQAAVHPGTGRRRSATSPRATSSVGGQLVPGHHRPGRLRRQGRRLPGPDQRHQPRLPGHRPRLQPAIRHDRARRPRLARRRPGQGRPRPGPGRADRRRGRSPIQRR